MIIKQIELEARFNLIMKQRDYIRHRVYFEFMPHIQEWWLCTSEIVDEKSGRKFFVYVNIDIEKLDNYKATEKYLHQLRDTYLDNIQGVANENNI